MDFRIRGLMKAMADKCGESKLMWKAFTSPTSKQIDRYYQAVKFNTLKYSGGFKLSYTYAFESRQPKNIYYSIYKYKRGSKEGMLSAAKRVR